MPGDAGQRMDRMYRLQRHIYDLTRRHYLVGRMNLISGLVPLDGGSVLEIGCGTAWNLIEAARCYPNAVFYGFDVSAAMLDTARRNIERAGLSERITITQGDATTFSGESLFSRQYFDRIFASYVISMVPGWTATMERAIDHVAPGGSFHIVDFGGASRLPRPLQVGLVAWLDQFDVVPRIELEDVVKQLALQHRMTPFFTELRFGYAQYAVLSR